MAERGERKAKAVRPTPGQVARAEAAEYRGHGRSAIATGYRDRLIHRLALRGLSAHEIVERTGINISTVTKRLAAVARATAAKVTAYDVAKAAAAQLDRYDTMMIELLAEIDALPVGHRSRPRLRALVLATDKERNRYLERIGLLKPLDQGGPPDAGDLRGLPSHVIEEQMARIASDLHRRLSAAGWQRSVAAMREGDVIDVEVEQLALPPGEGSAT